MTELYINNTLVDLFDDMPMSFTYSIADIREPDKRNTSYSKTITIPGSKNNNILFSGIFNVNLALNSTGTTNFSPHFNPNLKASARVAINTAIVFSGIVQLLKINITDNYEITYDIALFGNLANIFKEIGDRELDDLDLSAYNHTYNQTNIVASWSATVGTGYVYPMIDYGFNDLTNWKLVHFFPAIYLKTILDKIFSDAGFTYTCSLFNSDSFKRKIIPMNTNGFKLSDSQITNRQFSASRTSDYSTNLSKTSTSFTIPYSNEISDPGNNYDPITLYAFTAPANGTWDFFFEIITQTTLTPASTACFNGGTNAQYFIYKTDTSGNSATIGGSQLHNGFGIGITSIIQCGVTTSGLSSGVYSNNGNIQVSLLAGEKIFIKVQAALYYSILLNFPFHNGTTGAAINGTVSLTIKSGSKFYNKVVNSGVQEGDTVSVNSALPQKIKQRDVLISIIRAYNLYIQDDPDVSNNLIITPRNDFYTSGTVDWTGKRDISQAREIEPMGALEALRYTYTYDYDDDYYNSKYKNTYNRTYGDRIIDVTNDFIKDTKETKLIFASTPSVGQKWNNRVIPTIVSVDQNGNKTSRSSKLRLLHYGGLKPCLPSWNFITAGNTTSYSTYPYSGHLDDPYNSTEDLNFGVPSEIYWTSGTIYYTNNNLHNKYHKQFIEEITDKDSKIVTAYYHLTTSDINTLDFRKFILDDNQYYILNKIEEYNPTIDQLTKVELLKVKSYPTFAPTSGTVLGGFDVAIAGEILPLLNNPFTGGINKSNAYSGPQIISGEGNYIDPTAKGVLINGSSYNYIGANTTNISLSNSSGCTVLGGLSNVTFINTSGTTAYEDGAVYLKGNRLDKAPIWRSFPFYYTDFNSVASSTSSKLLFPLLPGQAIEKIVVRGVTPFDGSATEEFYVDIGVIGDQTRYLVNTINLGDSNAGNFLQKQDTFYLESFNNSYDVYMFVKSNTILTDMTAGEGVIHIQITSM